VGFLFLGTARNLTAVFERISATSQAGAHKKTAGVAVNAAQANPIHAQRERPNAEDSVQAAGNGPQLNREFLILISI
jgi:hypothetical protein